MSQRRTSVRVTGKTLYLTEDLELLKKQLRGEQVSVDPQKDALVNNISTDELTPGWVCYYYDETLARYCLVGLRGGAIQKDDIKNGGFGVIVSGRSSEKTTSGRSLETCPAVTCPAAATVAKRARPCYEIVTFVPGARFVRWPCRDVSGGSHRDETLTSVSRKR